MLVNRNCVTISLVAVVRISVKFFFQSNFYSSVASVSMLEELIALLLMT